MKKQILFIGAFLISTMGFSQTLYTSDGLLNNHRKVILEGRNLTFIPSASKSEFFVNGSTGFVGLGKTNPTSRLDVNGDISAKRTFNTYNIPDGTNFSNSNERNDKCIVFSAGSILGSGQGYVNTRMLNFFDFPQSNIDPKSIFHFNLTDRSDNTRFRVLGETGGTTWMQLFNKSQEGIFEILEDGNDKVELTLPKSNSFVGIGTTNFIDGTDIYRLAVKGAIRADRVKVYTTWADYVFEKDYKLPTLEEVEKHIAEKGHLQDIPSAAEVEKNGIELGEMNKLLLQKVEELTLYVIELNKEIKELKAKND